MGVFLKFGFSKQLAQALPTFAGELDKAPRAQLFVIRGTQGRLVYGAKLVGAGAGSVSLPMELRS
ncbi:hypothetical protein HAALTHF_46960n [Vreelandella aquamarina]|nr:hypothetical protein HAALTHF_46960n [Halomonas axialensis]